MGRPKKKLSGADLILKERKEQTDKHKKDAKYDSVNNNDGQLLIAVSKLINRAAPARQVPPRTWNKELWAKMLKKPLKERLIIAGALIAAEVDVMIENGEE